MKRFSFKSIAFVVGLSFLVITTTGCDKGENGDNAKVDPTSPLKIVATGDFVVKQDGVEVQTIWAKLQWEKLNDTTHVWHFSTAQGYKADFFPMKIDSVIIGSRDGRRFYVAKDQIPEINSKPNSEYKITSFEAHILTPYIIVDMNMGDFSVNFKGKQNR